jgi:signal transduction histidine kinase/ligand-binding sensor domain-containing protein/CheY-like chemotaxis protein
MTSAMAILRVLLRATALALGLGLALSGDTRASTLEQLPSLPGYVHEVFTAADGLPMAGIVQALQTRDGFLWLATFDGLVRFDGARFEVFDSERFPALGSNRIVTLFESRDGVLWIHTEQGHLVRYAKGVFTACPAPKAGFADCRLSQTGAPYYTAFHGDRSGNVWAGGPAGVLRAEGSGLREVPELKTESPVQSLFRDRLGQLWVGTRKDLWLSRPGHLQRMALPGYFEQASFGVAVETSGEVWVTTPQGVGRLVGGTFELEYPGLGNVGEDPQGGVWITVGNRLIRRRGSRSETLWASDGALAGSIPAHSVRLGPAGEVWAGLSRTVTRNGRPVLSLPWSPGSINSLCLDREGTVWVTTSRAELHALHPTRLTTFAEGLPSPIIYPIYEDRDGTIWAGGGGFLASLAPGAERFRALFNPEGPEQGTWAFLRDRAGTFWVGTTHGLYTLGPGGLTPAGDARLRNHLVRAIFEGSHGDLWLGSEEGLFHRDPLAAGGHWTWLRPEDGLPFPRIRVIRETPDGALWIGTNGGGVIRLAAGRFTVINHAQGLSSDLVRAIWVAPDGRLWIGTENRGLNRLDLASIDAPGGPRIASLGERQGLYANGIHQIVADDFGNLWMSSNHGVFRARLADLNAAADGKLARVETVAVDTVAYTERDGMRAREANGSMQDAGLRDRAGRIWFPTQNGVVRIDPRVVLRRRKPPQALVEGLRVGSEERPLAEGGARLSSSQRSFAVEFTAPSFLAPERQRFRFRLVPYDHTWIEAGERREAVYTKVPPGSYRFEVLASGPDGEWSPRPASVTLEVVPRFFETAWFRAICTLAALASLIGILILVVRLRGARQRARQQELERLVEERTATIARQAEKLREVDQLKSQFFANISHELRTPLTLTLGPLQDALDGRFGPLREDFAGQIEVARHNAQRLLGLVDQLLDVVRLDAGRLRLRLRRGDLAAAVRQRVESLLPLAERRGIELSLEAPAEPVEAWFDEVQIEKVFDNLLGNALKFTPPGGKVHAAVVAQADDPRIAVSVRDTGPGIPADQLERVFERFYLVEASASRRWPGAGIGLALARQLVEMHGGTLTAQSSEGEGACFTVTLRRGRDHLPAELVDSGPAERERPAGSITVLTPTPLEPLRPSDSEAIEREADRTTVLVAADGAEGLEQARLLLPDLVVSDVMMPGLDGNALFRSLRQDPELEFVPVVLLTAKASAESRIQGLREGVDDYIVKPFDPRELKARVDNLIASRKRLLARFETVAPRPLRVSEVSVTPADEAFLARVQAVVEERLGDSELTVEGLAEALGCDRSYLLRKLRTLAGETPSGLIRSLRLQRAEQLLRAGAGSVSEIAYGVGFKSVAHFSNAFQERFGERPSAFAARHRGR